MSSTSATIQSSNVLLGQNILARILCEEPLRSSRAPLSSLSEGSRGISVQGLEAESTLTAPAPASPAPSPPLHGGWDHGGVSSAAASPSSKRPPPPRCCPYLRGDMSRIRAKTRTQDHVTTRTQDDVITRTNDHRMRDSRSRDTAGLRGHEDDPMIHLLASLRPLESASKDVSSLMHPLSFSPIFPCIPLLAIIGSSSVSRTRDPPLTPKRETAVSRRDKASSCHLEHVKRVARESSTAPAQVLSHTRVPLTSSACARP